MATRKELKALGVKPPGAGAEDEEVAIEDVAGAAFRYDEPGQRIFFTLDDSKRVPKTYDLRGSIPEAPAATTDYGAVVNYQIYASSSRIGNRLFSFNGGNATLDGRVFGPLGYVTQSAILGVTTTSRKATGLRLDTTYTYSDPVSLRSLRAGDVISSGLPWTHSLRLGGIQFQRDFSLRPDLVTQPLPSISGSAAVPSTLDIFVNNVRLQSQDVPAGPYEVTNIPALTPGGSAQVVLRDASGRLTQMSVPFFTSPRLLRQGIFDYSFEVGAPRLRYAIESNLYSRRIMGSASLRSGVFDWLTAEAHVEADARLQNAGAGLVVDVASLGVASLALSGSRMGDMRGLQAYAALDTRIGDIYIHASARRSFGRYLDLAALTSSRSLLPFQSALTYGLNPFLSTILARETDTFNVSMPFAFDRSQIGAGFVRYVPWYGRASNLVTLNYSRPIFSAGNVFINGFFDLTDKGNSGVFLGLTMPLDETFGRFAPTFVSAGVTRTSRGLNGYVEATKTMQPEPGSYGWRVRDSEGAFSERLAAGSYRSKYGQYEAYLQQYGKYANGAVSAHGAIAAMGGGVFLSNRIDDAFAVVDAGAPNVHVNYENRPAGTTNSRGLALIPMLRSFQRNRVGIDIRNLPLNAEADSTREIVAPANRGGVVVKFGVKTDVKSAVVIFSRVDGRPVEAGAEGQLEGSSENFVVGYDGRAYIKALQPENAVVIHSKDGDCRASFAYAPPQREQQVVIGPVTCH